VNDKECYAQLAFEISRAQLYSQKDDLRNFRNQASFSAAFTSLLATVFAGLVEPASLDCGLGEICFLGLNPLFIAAISGLVGSLCLSVLVISGWKSCTFELNPHWVLEKGNDGANLFELHKMLAIDADTYFDKNEVVISEARRNLQLSLLVGMLQIPFWIVLIQS
jgi:hypothetical protein